MQNKILVGLDPSYKRTGIAMYTGEKIYVTEVKYEANSDKSFEQIFKDVDDRVRDITYMIKFLYSKGPEGAIQVLSECPPPQGNFAPGLYALDVSLFREMRSNGWGLYRVYPTFLGHVHGKRGYAKSESVEVAKKILSYYNHVLLTKRLSHDQAEAVIFLARNMAKEGVLRKEISDEYRGLLSEKEVLLK